MQVSSSVHSSLYNCHTDLGYTGQDILAATDSYPENLTNTISTIKNSLPTAISLPSINGILESQAEVSSHMASHLESLASHYDQMAGALREGEAGEVFSEEDLQGRYNCLSASFDLDLCFRRHESRYGRTPIYHGRT
jgi:hypothetical protein